MKDLALVIDGGNGQQTFTISPPSGVSSVQGFANNFFFFSSQHSLVSQLVYLLLIVSVVLSFIFVLIGGLKWIASQGDKKAVEGARNTIVYAIGGMTLSILAYLILALLGKLLNITLLR